MYAFISGRVVSAREGVMVLENNGIGYELNVSNNTLDALGTVGKAVQLFTYLSVREDGVSLFGFYSQEEKEMFFKLTAISGIGPKVALSILSGTTLSSLAVAIVTEDAKTLSKIKGIGKKTAERIILELKENITAAETGDEAVVRTGGGSDIDDAVAALVALGVSRSEAYTAVANAKPGASSIEELISLALRSMSRL